MRIQEPIEEEGEMLFVHDRFPFLDVVRMSLCEIGGGLGAMTIEQLPDELKEVTTNQAAVQLP